MTVIGTRHALSMGNKFPSYYRDMEDKDISIAPDGYGQAVLFAEFINNFLPEYNQGNRPVKVYASPYDRTDQTAQICMDNAPNIQWGKIIYDWRLVERNMGMFAGYNEQEASVLFPKENTQYELDKKQYGAYYARPPKGESCHDVTSRVKYFAKTLNPHCINLVFSHGKTLSCLEMYMTNMNVDQFYTLKNLDNTASRLLEFKDNRYVSKGEIYAPQAETMMHSKIMTHPSGGTYKPSQLMA